MLKKVMIVDPGQTTFIPGQQVDAQEFERENNKAIDQGCMPAVAEPVLLGITKAALNTDSFLSAASFQNTTSILTKAAIKGDVDHLCGMKEAMIVGALIPAGTGFIVKKMKAEAYKKEQEQYGADTSDVSSAG